jgi:hypothetical protein
MRKKLYIENKDEAYCSECGKKCNPICDDGSFDYEYGSIKGTDSDGEEWTSDCHSAPMIDSCNDEWIAVVCEGCPEE